MSKLTWLTVLLISTGCASGATSTPAESPSDVVEEATETAEPEGAEPADPAETGEGAAEEPAEASEAAEEPPPPPKKKSCADLDEATCKVTMGCAFMGPPTKKCVDQ